MSLPALGPGLFVALIGGVEDRPLPGPRSVWRGVLRPGWVQGRFQFLPFARPLLVRLEGRLLGQQVSF